jgi:hypothetical protein
MSLLQKSLLGLLVTLPGGLAGGKDSVDTPPVYNVKTEIQFEGVIDDVRQVSSGALTGIFLTVKTKTDTLDLYLGPVKFIELFGMEFKVGTGLEVIGSTVKFESEDVVLGREVTMGKTKLVLRTADGSPNWRWMVKDYPSGL